MLNRMMRRKLKSSNIPEVEKEQKPPRALSEIQNDYKEACAALGDRSYRIAVLQAEVHAIQNKLAELNKEANAIPKQEEVPSEESK